MDEQFNTGVYNYTSIMVGILLEKFGGKVVGSEDMNNEVIMDEFFGDFKPGDKEVVLKKTSESQGHGKAWEIDIAEKIYGIEKPKEKYKNNIKYDIPLIDNNLHDKNVSIKTSGGMSIDMGDILRFLSSENMHVVSVIYKQKDGLRKEAKETRVFDFDDFKKILIEDLEKCDFVYDDWYKKIKDYVDYVKSLPKEYYPESKNKPASQKEHLLKKIPLCKNIQYFNIAPKIDSDQQRVQCSINLRKIPGLKQDVFEGGVLFDKEYTKIMMSSSRNRKKKK